MNFLTRWPSVLTLVLAALLAEVGYGQTYGSDSHTVRVSVLPIATVSASVGAVSLNMASGTIIPGQDQMVVTDQSTTLSWGINSANRKITASTSLATPLFQLKMAALNPTRGTAAPEFIVSTVGRDVILNVGRSTGTCAIRYTGTALASQGAGTDHHVITFTVQTQ